MRKKLIFFLFIFFGNMLTLQAEDYQMIWMDEIEFRLWKDSREAEVTNTKKSGRVDIPESVEYEGEIYNVTGIYGGFGFGTEVTAVQIPKTIRYISQAAFYENMGKLKETHITDLAAWCGIENHGTPQAYSGNLFLNGKDITELMIPDGVEVLGCGTFSNLRHITSITLPDGLKSIGEIAFSNCRGVTGHIEIPQSVTKIDREAFSNMKNLESVTLPDSLTEIVRGIFWGCDNLQSVKFPEQLTKIGKNAFSGCRSLKEIVLPDKLETIGELAFSDCRSLEKIDLGKGVKTIEKRAFESCIIKDIVLPESIEQIKSQAFACQYLERIFCYAETVPKCDGGAFTSSYQMATLYVPGDVIEDYRKDSEWGKFAKIEAIEAEDNPDVIDQPLSASTNRGKVEAIYDLQGRRMEKAPQKGIYVQDGKKIVK